jgi:hypothetical protein
MHQSLVGELNPITAVTLEETQPLMISFGEDAIPLAYIEKSALVQRLAMFEDQSFIQTEDGLMGWVIQ